MLEESFVPKVAAWLKTDEPTMEISKLFDLGTYDAICMIPEYSCFSGGKNEVTKPLREIHSSFGKCVPENRVAFMVVSNDVAHAALLDTVKESVNVMAFRTCVKGSNAILRKSRQTESQVQLVKIEEK